MTQLDILDLALRGANEDISSANELLKILTQKESIDYWTNLRSARIRQAQELEELREVAFNEWIESL